MLLPLLEVAISTTTNASTKYPPYTVLFGRAARLPLQVAVEGNIDTPGVGCGAERDATCHPNGRVGATTGCQYPTDLATSATEPKQEQRAERTLLRPESSGATVVPGRLGFAVYNESSGAKGRASQITRTISGAVCGTTHSTPECL